MESTKKSLAQAQDDLVKAYREVSVCCVTTLSMIEPNLHKLLQTETKDREIVSFARKSQEAGARLNETEERLVEQLRAEKVGTHIFLI